VQFVLEIFEIFCRNTLYMYLEGKMFFTQMLFLVQELCPKNKILVNLGQLGQPKNYFKKKNLSCNFFHKFLTKFLNISST
jgi:hypothetical protein